MMEILEAFLHFALNWYWIPLLLLYAGVTGTILIENGNPTKTLAWLLVIILVPFFGLLLYYFFGQKFVKEKKIEKITEEQIVRMDEELELIKPVIDGYIQEIHEDIGDFSKVFRLIKNEKLSTPTLNNAVDLLINGEQKFAALQADLKKATHSIHLEYYIFEPDHTGLEILNILEEKANDGVKVRLIVDGFGSPDMIKYMAKQKDSKILFQSFLPVRFSSLADSNYRNHRKVAVIDGNVGYVGGINISDKYSNDPSLSNEVYWRDTAVRMEGVCVTLLQIEFWNAWNQTEGDPFHLAQGYMPFNNHNYVSVGTASVGFVSCNPASKGPFNMEALLIAIGEATKSIQLCTPYYVPGEELERSLIMAAAAGVKVELMIPAQSDSFFVKHASRSFLKAILERGVQVYFYEKGFLHAKTANIDGKLTFIGTVNLDIRSFYINYEIAAVIADATLCRQAVAQFELDKLDARSITYEEWLARPRWKRSIDSICRLLSPLL